MLCEIGEHKLHVLIGYNRVVRDRGVYSVPDRSMTFVAIKQELVNLHNISTSKTIMIDTFIAVHVPDLLITR